MSDLISREAVLQIIDKKTIRGKLQVAREVQRLPSAQKTGKWKLLHKGNKTSDYECTNCRGILMDVANDDHHELQRFCGMCGARMECEEE